jgi:glycosyltransferase involved in cell wall biosynthesis
MRILILAPHPFFQVRGSPIGLENLVQALSARVNAHVDLLVYAEGEDRYYPGVTMHRIADLPFTRNVRPGFSLKKLICDALLFWKAWSRIRRNRYDVVHAVEETAFMALALKAIHRIPYVYDLDSSLAQQMVESMPILEPGSRFLSFMERVAVRGALATAPVCNALSDLCVELGAHDVFTLHDISQLKEPAARRTGRLSSRVGRGRLILLYTGNLEAYQGVDLLLRAFAIVAARSDAIDLVVIGGIPEHIAAYEALARALGIAERVEFAGPRPLEQLGENLADADILVSPRIRGLNTPMKVFSYLHSGRPLVATDLPTHSQILTGDAAVLAAPEPDAFAQAILSLVDDPEARARIGRAGREFVEADHTVDAYRRRVNRLYDWVEAQIDAVDLNPES